MIKSLGKSLLTLVIVGFLFGCNDKTIEVTNTEDNGSKGILYEVTHENNTVYLFGTLHFSNRTLLPLNEKIEEAYNQSNYLAVELNPNTINRRERNRLFKEVGTYTDGTTIKDNLSSEVYEALILALNDLGIEEKTVENLKPWAIDDTLLGEILFKKGGATYELGMDQYFIRKANQDNKKIIELETLEEKLNVYAAATDDLQELALKERLQELDELDAMFQEEITDWINGDIEKMEKYRVFELDGANPKDIEVAFEAFYLERDRKMAQKIEEFLLNGNSEAYFVAVGAYHLVGENSIVDLLKKSGYDVNKIIN
ncbi:MAG: TraB/GumN family protein [Anaerobacillus sp.]|uniref:TraB/GumN family protein n=1 Tax=Anaerobacillus sp. TaxID=1872506 RepID=UPI00391B14A3